jgi:hypothetical protein
MLLPELLQSLCVETHSDHADSAGWQAEMEWLVFETKANLTTLPFAAFS